MTSDLTPRQMMDAVIAEWCEEKPTEAMGRKVSLYDWESKDDFWACSVAAPIKMSTGPPASNDPLAETLGRSTRRSKIPHHNFGVSPNLLKW